MSKLGKFFCGVAVSLSLVMATSVCLQVFGTGKQKPSEWFGKDNTEQTTPDEDKTTDGAIIGESESNGVKLMSKEIARAEYAANGINERADSAYILTATFTPENTTDKRLHASLSFKNAESEWASGKTVTDYVTVRVDGKEIILTCLQAFGEQINLRVDTNYENVYATTTIDYIARSTEVTVGMGALTQTGVGENGKPVYTIGGDNSKMTFNQGEQNKYGVVPGFVNHSVGTLRPSVRLIKVELTLSEEILRDVSFLSGPCHVGYVSVGEKAEISNGFMGNEHLGYAFTANQEMLMQMLHSEISAERVLPELASHVHEGYPYITCKATCEVYYGEKVISTEVVTKGYINTYFSPLFTAADNVTLGDDHIIF